MTLAARNPALNLSAREIEFHDVPGREVHHRCVTLVDRMRDECRRHEPEFDRSPTDPKASPMAKS